jgi:hypothetical protein
MKKVLLYILIGIALASCANTKKVPKTTEVTIVTYKDSVAWHDSTIYHEVYHEHYKDYTGLLDTLKMETTYNTFTAYNDTLSNHLMGEVENKDISLPIQIKWKEKVVYKDSIEYKTKEVPVEVEVVKKVYPKSYWVLLALVILGAIVGGIKLYLKFKI